MTEAARLIGCGVSTLSNYVNGKTEAGEDLIKKLATFLKMRVEDVPKRLETALELREGYVARPLARRVPVVSFTRAGAESFTYDDLANQIDETVQTECRDANCFALFVEGDSMEPSIKAGDIAVVAPNDSPRNGDTVVARLSKTGGVLLKVYHQVGARGERVRLTSYNSAVYPPLEYDRGEFRFIYPVVELTRKLRRG